MLLGVMPTILPYKHETVQLQPDDIIVLFTDGITEAMSFDGIEYSDERLEKLASSGLATAEELLNNIINDVHKFTAGAQQSDDITAMVIKVI
jgi:sigma-B regulation protein RsbU (phosphoserine phosphatase)